MIRRENAQFEFGAGGIGGRKFQVGGVLATEHFHFHGSGFCLGGSSRNA